MVAVGFNPRTGTTQDAARRLSGAKSAHRKAPIDAGEVALLVFHGDDELGTREGKKQIACPIVLPSIGRIWN